MFVTKAIDNGKLSQEIIFTLEVVPGEPLDGDLQILLRNHTFIDHTETTLTQSMLLVEVVGSTLEFLTAAPSRRSWEAFKRTQYIGT